MSKDVEKLPKEIEEVLREFGAVHGGNEVEVEGYVGLAVAHWEGKSKVAYVAAISPAGKTRVFFTEEGIGKVLTQIATQIPKGGIDIENFARWQPPICPDPRYCVPALRRVLASARQQWHLHRRNSLAPSEYVKRFE